MSMGKEFALQEPIALPPIQAVAMIKSNALSAEPIITASEWFVDSNGMPALQSIADSMQCLMPRSLQNCCRFVAWTSAGHCKACCAAQRLPALRQPLSLEMATADALRQDPHASSCVGSSRQSRCKKIISLLFTPMLYCSKKAPSLRPFRSQLSSGGPLLWLHKLHR